MNKDRQADIYQRFKMWRNEASRRCFTLGFYILPKKAGHMISIQHVRTALFTVTVS